MPSVELGCGPRSKLGDIGVDRIPGPAVDVVHDLNNLPWPLPSSEFEHVICLNVLEHLTDFLGVMGEIHRIAKPDAVVEIRVPTPGSADLFTDPTHVRGFGYRSFEYLTERGHRGQLAYSVGKFRIRRARFERAPGRFLWWLDRLMVSVANQRPDFYEGRLCFLYPMTSLYFELEVVK